ncbi:MAG: Flp pilus assembly complex ATPase component TadA, partial [Elusimicrobia bacterium]|nr:Flp pilus assembly complex ATPase component TadA [Elusimicrobiota bacterium]
ETQPYLSHALLDAGLVTPDQFAKLVEQTFKVKYMPLSTENADRFGLKLVPEKTCRKYNVVPVGVSEEEIRLAMADPLNFDAQSDVEAITGRRVVPLYSLPRAVDSCLEQLFNTDTVIFELLSKVEAGDEVQVLGGEASEDDKTSVSGPVIMLVNSIISQAYRKHSSDIHIEHEQKSTHVRIRIDGVLKSIMTIPRHLGAGPLVSRIKIMADLDVSNHMRPQDGRAKLSIGGAEVGLRVSTLPTSHGEKVVMRILDQRAAEVPFDKLGFAPEVSAVLETCLAASQGIILVTGPTGSGKTTTLYSVLNKTRSEKTNIVTVEDPIEYKLAGINQVQINDKQGLSFAAVLRSVLRQDPDVIMVGEIRDRETADIAFQAAMTGHMVFSTLHTNDSVSTIGRLIDMGLDRFKISPALLAITAQRLVRRLCPVCSEKVPAGEIDKTLLNALDMCDFEKAVYRATGCKNCEGSGYVGRTSMVEILRVTPRIKDLINSGGRPEEITRLALEEKALRTLSRDALWHLSVGNTDLAEVSPYLILNNKAPACDAPPLPAAIPAPLPARPVASVGGKPRVMIAEDDAIMRLLLKKFIEGAGLTVIEAGDGEDALTAIASGPPPDLLVSDINMPRMNGLDLVKGVRGNLGMADMPIIMLTTETSDKSQELAFKLGADDYIIKPFKAPLVIARITAALRRAGKLK